MVAHLKLGSETLDLPLKGPRQLSKPPGGPPGGFEQQYDDSFTGTIPKEWVAPGLKVTVEMKEGTARVLDAATFDKLAIGAPTRLVMTMFDFHFFGGDKDGDYPAGWLEGLAARLPVAELEVRRVRRIMFDNLVMNPRGVPATLCGSRDEYRKKTGQAFDGEQALAGMWNGALREAAGAGWGGTRRLYYSNIYGVPCGGTGGGLSGEGNGRQHGILLHELGHAFGLPDLMGGALQKYPYVGPVRDHPVPGDQPNVPHVGPTWGFDPVTHEFLPSVWSGCHRRDPMGGGGGNKDGGPGGLYRFFSDYHFSRIRDCLESTQVIRDERSDFYLVWNQGSGSYSTRAREMGRPNCPVEDDGDVISVLASASLVTPEANMVYPPIGPYKAGRAATFDASSAADRGRAQSSGYGESACLCLSVTQGSKVTTYLVKKELSSSADPSKPESFAVFAINLPARDGDVTQVDLLHAPGVMQHGVKSDCRVLSRWKATSSAQKTEAVIAMYPPDRERLDGDSRKSSRLSRKRASGPSAPPPQPAASPERALTAERRAVLDRALAEALTKLSGASALKPVPLRLSVIAVPVVLVSAEAGGGLTLKPAGGGEATKVTLEGLSAVDRTNLAILVAETKPDSTDVQAMAGVYLEISGNVPRAETYYQKAGHESRAKFERLFE